MHFHRDVLAIADTFGKHLVQGRPDDIFTGTPPLAFTFGLGGLLVFPLRVGAVDAADRTGHPDRTGRARRAVSAPPCCPPRRPPTGRSCGPAQQDRLATIRRAVSAGEHLPQAVWQEMFDKTGIRLIDGIGSTEMLHVFISAADDDIRPGATGRAVPGYQAAVLDAEGNPVPDGTPGRLAVIGPTCCRYLADARQARLRPARLEHHRRHLPPRRRRLLLVPGPQRRHDRLAPATTSPRPRWSARWSSTRTCVECAVVARPDAERGLDRARGGGAARRGARPTRPRSPSCRSSPSRRSRRTSTRGRSSSSRRCRGPRPASCSGSGCASRPGRAESGIWPCASRYRRRPGRAVLRRAGQGAGPGRRDRRSGSATPPDDTFGFGVVFSDETLGGIEHADPVIYARMAEQFARWDDIDVHFRRTA